MGEGGGGRAAGQEAQDERAKGEHDRGEQETFHKRAELLVCIIPAEQRDTLWLSSALPRTYGNAPVTAAVGAAFADGVAAGAGDFQLAVGGLGGEVDDALSIGDEFVEDLHAGGFDLAAEAVFVGTAGVIPIAEEVVGGVLFGPAGSR